MNIDIERLKHDIEYWEKVAPEGATHYREDAPFIRWYRIDGNMRLYFSNILGRVWTESESKGGVFIPRPGKQWSGSEDGLPPVGVECELCTGSNWVKVTIVAHDEWSGRTAAVYRRDLSAAPLYECSPCPSSFRPLKSEKDRVVEAMMNLLGWQYADKDALGILYDAGALKMPEDN